MTNELKTIRYCPDCEGEVDENGDTIAHNHCAACSYYSKDAPGCETCGFFYCDQSC